MSRQLFDPTLVYPSDEKGLYVDLEGTVVGITEFGAAIVSVPEHGEYTGYNETMFERARPKAGDKATIRVYDAGGGFYPDNRIVRWVQIGDPGPCPIKGCQDHACQIAPPKGMGTNGGCRCSERDTRLALQWAQRRIAFLESRLIIQGVGGL